MSGDSPIIHVDILGNMGNRMMQFMTAYSIASQVPGCRISNIRIPEFDLYYDEIPEDGGYKYSITHTVENAKSGRIDTENLVTVLKSGSLKRVVLAAYCQHIGNFGHPELFAQFFSRPIADAAGYGPDDLLINLRMGDIANGHHRDYILLPVEFYVEVVKSTGLRPVFLGQIEDNVYCRALKDAFPYASFVRSGGAKHDFECIRRSKNILLCISTFSWLAAWLSEADRIIMPVAGVFHPRQHPSSVLIPLGDPRYSYYLFPIHHAVPVAEVAGRHQALQGLWRLVTEAHLADMLRGPRYSPSKTEQVRRFDEAYYQKLHYDVRVSVEQYGLPSGLSHYVATGYDELRRGFEIDPIWYFKTHLMAAIEVGQGDYLDAAHHYAAVGAARGYTAVPPEYR